MSDKSKVGQNQSLPDGIVYGSSGVGETLLSKRNKEGRLGNIELLIRALIRQGGENK